MAMRHTDGTPCRGDSCAFKDDGGHATVAEIDGLKFTTREREGFVEIDVITGDGAFVTVQLQPSSHSERQGWLAIEIDGDVSTTRVHINDEGVHDGPHLL